MNTQSVSYAAFSLRISLFILMSVWALMKIVAPASYAGNGNQPGIFQTFYGADFGNSFVLILGIGQVILLLAFATGMFKTVTSGAVLAMNSVSLAVSMPYILDPFVKPNLLFLASVPVLGASLAHFLLRRYDTVFSLGR
jgi:hypothetical protein